METNDMIYNNKNGTINVGQYKLNNALLENNISPYVTFNQHGGGTELVFSELFKNLAVPSGLLYLQQTMNTSSANILDEVSENVIKPDLYNSLLQLVSPTKPKNTKQKNTKRRKKKSKNKTRKRA